jgi:hypothetical protein
MHWIALALAFAWARVGNSKPARIAMMAMTTSNSIKVNALLPALREARFARRNVLK